MLYSAPWYTNAERYLWMYEKRLVIAATKMSEKAKTPRVAVSISQLNVCDIQLARGSNTPYRITPIPLVGVKSVSEATALTTSMMLPIMDGENMVSIVLKTTRVTTTLSCQY